MMKKMMTIIVLVFISTMNTAYTKDLIEPAYGLWGGAVINRDSNYLDTESETTISPFILGGYGPIFIEANRAGWSFYRDGTIFASVVGQLRTHQFKKNNNDSEFSGSKDRTRAIELGFQIGMRLPAGFFTRLAVLQDVSGTHNSHEFDVQLYRRDVLGPIRLLSAIGLQYQNKELVDYYYGTPSYKPNDAFGAELELIATYPIGNWGVFAGTRSYIFDRQVSDSPLADSNLIIQVFSGVGYYF